MILWILVAYGVALAAGLAFMVGAGRRPWWEQTTEDLDSLPTTEEGPGADSETLSPDDHETR